MPLVKLLHVIAWTDCLEKVKRGEWHKFFRSLVSSQVVQHDYKMVESLVEFQMHWRTIFKRFGFSLKFQFHAFPVRLFFFKVFSRIVGIFLYWYFYQLLRCIQTCIKIFFMTTPPVWSHWLIFELGCNCVTVRTMSLNFVKFNI